jgi:hypothetical protein
MFKTGVVTRFMERIEKHKLRRCANDEGKSEMSAIALTFGGVGYAPTANGTPSAWLLPDRLAVNSRGRVGS